jgi:ubiquinone/menaquinone biosynthesis C-methylase UbiE
MKQYYWKEFIEDINKDIFDGATVFDAGAGDGHWRERLPKNIKYISMDMGVGDASVDYSHLDIAGDLRRIPLADNSVDVIICIQVLEHLPEPWTVIQELHRILKPGGKVFASCPQGEPQHQVPYDFFRYTIYGLRSIFEQYKFNVDFIIPQTGNFAKIRNDINHSADIMVASHKKMRGIFLKFMAKIIGFLYSDFDKNPTFQTNTVGHFIKVSK